MLVALVLTVLAGCSRPTIDAVVSAVTITEGPQLLLVGDSVALGVTVATSGGASEAVTWSSSAPDVASVSAAGVVEALAGGSATITATSAFDAERSDSVLVSVVAPGAATALAATDGSLVSVTSVALGAPDLAVGVRRLSLDVAWDEAWRGPARPSWVAADDAWDAAWLFAKYRVGDGDWQHLRLAADGHLVPAGASLDVSPDGLGAFVYRSAPGYVAWAAEGLGLAWDYGVDGVDPSADVIVRVYAIEMVYVPAGAFSLGTGGGESNTFRDGASASPFVVAGPEPIEVGSAAGQLNWTPSEFSGAGAGPVDPGFPTGYAAFYLMKRPLTIGQYVAFLNALTPEQAMARVNPGSSERHDVGTGVDGAYTTMLPYLPMRFASWADMAAYADWAGLRPITELEYEKAARGPLAPVAGEYAWGSTSIAAATGLIAAGTRHESPTPASANAAYGNALAPAGPVRAGSFAVARASRAAAGAGYYGALDLSGNLWERTVTIGNAGGRAFSGAHGDGSLALDGSADVVGWPTADAVGIGFRGGNWRDGAIYLRVSDRTFAALALTDRSDIFGWRGGRSAP